jgi:hypothetical protein
MLDLWQNDAAISARPSPEEGRDLPTASDIAPLLMSAGLYVLLGVGIWLYLSQRKIARAIDSTIVSALARAVSFSRTIRARHRTFVDRVIAEANERNPSD